MAVAGNLSSASHPRRIAMVRLAIVASVLAVWEAVSASGLVFRDVVPSLLLIARAIASLLGAADFYRNLTVTLGEIGAGLLIGGIAGLAVGIGLGASRFAAAAYESLVYYLGPTPKIIFFPVMIMVWIESMTTTSGVRVRMAPMIASS